LRISLLPVFPAVRPFAPSWRATLDTFSHVLGMDLYFHLHRKTGELLRIMDR
jgi:ABC-type transport system involved in Fe-S cluster assembly fused permease/ATPase subunit